VVYEKSKVCRKLFSQSLIFSQNGDIRLITYTMPVINAHFVILGFFHEHCLLQRTLDLHASEVVAICNFCLSFVFFQTTCYRVVYRYNLLWQAAVGIFRPRHLWQSTGFLPTRISLMICHSKYTYLR